MRARQGRWPELRAWFGLSITELGRCFGLSRAMMWQVETGHRALPLAATVPHLALSRARQETPPDPAPEPLDAAALRRQLQECQHRAGQLQYKLGLLREQAGPARRRLAAIPLITATYAAVQTAPPSWLAAFELEGRAGLQRSGRTAQALLQARRAALLAEAAELERLLAETSAGQ